MSVITGNRGGRVYRERDTSVECGQEVNEDDDI